jgi:glucose-1-phosphate thymidylyltransferase
MKAIIPAAGKGTRLLPYTRTLQKALMPVAGATVIDHILAPLIDAGIDELVFVVGHLGDQLEAHMAHYKNVKMEFVVQEQQKGLGHAVLLGLEQTDDPVVIVLSDSILDLDYPNFIDGHGNIIGVAKVEQPEHFGIVETVGQRVVELVEKPTDPVSNLAIVGIYRIAHQNKLRRALEILISSKKTTKGEYQLTDGLALMMEAGQAMHADVIDGWYDCGIAENLLKTNRILLQKQGKIEAIAESAWIESSTLRYASIGEECQIVESSLDNCIVLPGAALSRCSIHNEIIAAGDNRDGYTSRQ